MECDRERRRWRSFKTGDIDRGDPVEVCNSVSQVCICVRGRARRVEDGHARRVTPPVDPIPEQRRPPSSVAPV